MYLINENKQVAANNSKQVKSQNNCQHNKYTKSLIHTKKFFWVIACWTKYKKCHFSY